MGALLGQRIVIIIIIGHKILFLTTEAKRKSVQVLKPMCLSSGLTDFMSFFFYLMKIIFLIKSGYR